ncbi:hypothetical protein FACS1894111_00270 [Clostridia bacterium]|nr:hypothetical protein FACS1894111_00270 [Clostridia bacterium]
MKGHIPENYIAVETHCHSLGGSHCAHVSPEEIVKLYKEADYGVLILTNHYNQETIPKGSSAKFAAKAYIDRFLKVQELGAAVGLEVWFGIETCIAGGGDDFLIFGAESDFLLENLRLFAMSQKEVFVECERYGALLYQAHPYRSWCQRRNPAFMHGAEVYNGNTHHNSQDKKALAWAQKEGLLFSSGSDFHNPEDLGRGGILLPKEVSNGKSLVDYLIANEVELITAM